MEYIELLYYILFALFFTILVLSTSLIKLKRKFKFKDLKLTNYYLLSNFIDQIINLFLKASGNLEVFEEIIKKIKIYFELEEILIVFPEEIILPANSLFFYFICEMLTNNKQEIISHLSLDPSKPLIQNINIDNQEFLLYIFNATPSKALFIGAICKKNKLLDKIELKSLSNIINVLKLGLPYFDLSKKK